VLVLRLATTLLKNQRDTAMATDLVDDLPGASELQPREFPKRDYHFWMVFLALGVGNALGALEMVRRHVRTCVEILLTCKRYSRRFRTRFRPSFTPLAEKQRSSGSVPHMASAKRFLYPLAAVSLR
jgi:hypothetical protein